MQENLKNQFVGRMFVSPAFDYTLIGGAWSLVVFGLFIVSPLRPESFEPATIWTVVLFANSAHFAASTVRLYSKPAFMREFSFLSFGFPLVTIAVLALCVILPGKLGMYLQALYLAWSPFHYAKQTYGLSLMYTFRSGVKPDDSQKRLVYWVCMMPFLFVTSKNLYAWTGWLLTPEVANSIPGLHEWSQFAASIFLVLTFAGPIFLFGRIWREKGQILPLMVPVLIVSNGIWWTFLEFMQAFVVATVAHSVQYLAIMLVYHVREKLREPASSRGWVYHAASFYGKCLVLGYLLFNCWPYIFVWFGASYAESALLVAATINIHHFIVDAYIWRLRVPANQVALREAGTAASSQA